MKHLFSLIYAWFLISCCYFCLWVISDYLFHHSLFAFLFLPFAFRVGILLHSPKSLWLASYGAELSVILFLTQIYPELNSGLLLLLSAVNFPCTFYCQRYYQGKQGRKLAQQGLLALAISLINSAILSYFNFSLFYSFLVSLTGMVLLIPMCYLLDDFLFKRKWIPLTAALIHKPVSLRSKHIVAYLTLFMLNLVIQNYLPNEFQRFSLFFLAIPIILLAYYYGWQGAVLAALLNSVALIAATHHFSDLDLSALLLSITLQTITGIFLGLAIQHQRELNLHLSQELARNRQLSRQLIDSEERIRKQISQELHDEIGQNVTAIRTQASILKRVNSNELGLTAANMIEQLSLNVYDTVKGLLNRIRPRSLDDLTLQHALQNLQLELGFAQQQIECQFEWHNPQQLPLDSTLEITLYRLCQESLNNIIIVTANSAVSLFEIGGFVGSLVAGWGSDKLFSSNRGPMALLFAIGIFFSITALWLMPQEHLLLQSALLFCVGFFVFGPQMLIGMAAAECAHKKTAGAATGFVGLFAYLGAALAGYPLALILQHWQWTGFFIIIVCAAFAIGLLLLPFLRTQTHNE